MKSAVQFTTSFTLYCQTKVLVCYNSEEGSCGPVLFKICCHRVPRNHVTKIQSKMVSLCQNLSVRGSEVHSSYLKIAPHLASSYNHSIVSHSFHPISSIWSFRCHSAPIQISIASNQTLLVAFSLSLFLVSFYSTSPYPIRRLRGPPSRSLRRRMSKRAKAAAKPVLDEAQFERAISGLPPRFTPEELCNVIVLEKDPLVCLELFNWASKQHRFRHNVSSFHITIKKLGAAKMYQEMDDVVNQVLAIRSMGTEALYNTMIYYFTEARKLTRAVNIYNHMRDIGKLDCRPSITTFNILFAALLSRGKNSYINHMYMETTRCLFRQMIDDGIEPDIFSLNSMIKGYVLSLHVNDALRVFHQMGVVYKCLPNSFSYDYLIHGLCAQGRTNNARELCMEMKGKGFVPSSKSYKSIVNSLALSGEVDEAVKYLWEMTENQRSADFITYRTILDEICRQRGAEDAKNLLQELQEEGLLDGHTCRQLLHEVEGNIGNSHFRTQFS